MTDAGRPRFAGLRSTQVVFVALLLICIIQTGWWLLDQAHYTARNRDERIAILAGSWYEEQATEYASYGDEFFEARLINGDFTVFKALDFAFVLVDTNDFYTEFGKTGSRNQTDIACANHSYAHTDFTPLGFQRLFQKAVFTRCGLFYKSFGYSRSGF